MGARGVLPTSIELVAGGQEKARETGTWVAGDGVVAICAIFLGGSVRLSSPQS